jgi:two-component system response regulator NreC
MSIKVLLADDHKMTREGLRSLLQDLTDVEVVAEAQTGLETIRLAKLHLPDMIIMDVAMPELNGIEATRRVLNECPGVKVIGLSMHSERQLVLRMLRTGASAYLLKNCGFHELAEAIRIVHQGGTYLTPAISNVLLEEITSIEQGGNDSESNGLTPREREVLQLIAEAKTSKEIAAHLNISEKTVHSHRKKIMEKLKAKNIAELTRIAIRNGISSLE